MTADLIPNLTATLWTIIAAGFAGFFIIWILAAILVPKSEKAND